MTYSGFFPPWWKKADPLLGTHLLLGPILMLWKSEGKHNFTLIHRLTGYLAAAIWGEMGIFSSHQGQGCAPWQRCPFFFFVGQAGLLVIKIEKIYLGPLLRPDEDLC